MAKVPAVVPPFVADTKAKGILSFSRQLWEAKPIQTCRSPYGTDIPTSMGLQLGDR